MEWDLEEMDLGKVAENFDMIDIIFVKGFLKTAW